jgi:hypothetical protein
MRPHRPAALTRRGGDTRRLRPAQRTGHVALAILLVLSHPLWAVTIHVDETTCTLVDAITAANLDAATGGCPAGSGADTIALATDVSLTAVNNGSGGSANGLPRVTSEITVEGGGFTISRNASAMFRLLEVLQNGTLTLNDVTLENGYSSYRGGGIRSYGQVTLNDSAMLGNAAPLGGAIMNLGTLTLNGSVLSYNSANYGGSISNGFPGAGHNTLTLTNSTVSHNHGFLGGGGILNHDGHKTTLNGSTVAYNHGSHGGGIQNTGELELTNSTVSWNTGYYEGGGIWSDSDFTLTNTTVSGNQAGMSGGLHSDGAYWPTLANSILSGNSPENCRWPALVDAGNNFSSDASCGAGFAAITPGVDIDFELADNGGWTRTHALPPGSVAIDAAGDCGLETDQRGMLRDDGACDSGSYEFESCTITVTREMGNTLVFFWPDASPFDVVAGYLSELHADGDFSRPSCMGSYPVGPAPDTLPELLEGQGRYYLARGQFCRAEGYGDSSLDPDPRDELELSGPCP